MTYLKLELDDQIGEYITISVDKEGIRILIMMVICNVLCHVFHVQVHSRHTNNVLVVMETRATHTHDQT